MNANLVKEISLALDVYRRATEDAVDPSDRAEFKMLTAIAEKLIGALKAGDEKEVRLLILSFSRQVSDSLAMQPAQYVELSSKVQSLKKAIGL